jgi:hypothetical protein
VKSAGITDADVSVIANDKTHPDLVDGYKNEGMSGTATGGSIGAVVGGGAGLLTGLGLMAIPGVGPVVAAGWLAATLAGATAGAVTGGLVGALTGSGIDENDAHTYAEGIRRGGTLVTVRVPDDRYNQISEILGASEPVNLADRTNEYRRDGWDHFDDTVPPPGSPLGTPIPAVRAAALMPPD